MALSLSVRTVERHLSNIYAEARPGRTSGPGGCRRGLPEAPARLNASLRVGRQRVAWRARAIGWWRGSPGGRSRSSVALTARRVSSGSAEEPTMSTTTITETESPIPSRSHRRQVDAGGHGRAGQRAGPPVGRAVQLGCGPARLARRREPRAEPDRLPARRARRVRGRVPARHARAAVRRPARRRDRSGPLLVGPARPARDGRRGARPRRDRARHQGVLVVASRADRGDARRLAPALPDLSRPPQAEHGHAQRQRGLSRVTDDRCRVRRPRPET